MAKQSPSLYSISKTFMWFAIVSILLTASLGAIVFLDYQREWKTYQKQFGALKLKKAQEELKKASSGIDSKELTALQKNLEDTQKAFAGHKTEYARLAKESAALDPKISRAKAAFQGLKQYEDSYKYYLEEYRLRKDPKAAEMEKKLAATSPKVKKLKEDFDGLESEKAAKDAQAADFLLAQKTAQKNIDKLLEQKTSIEKRVKNLKPSLIKDALNAPMLDFVAPTLKVQQIVLEDLQDDYHFTKVQKVDRCTTCHLGIDQKGFEDAPQPFRTHPKLDLFLGSSSPHPLEKIGCTSCHGGSGQAVSFTETAHTPRDEKQEAEWVKKYHWKEFHHWETPMLPLQHVEAACAKCHTGAVEVPQAPELNKGRMLAQSLGCFECHKIKGFQADWKVGPDLTHVKGKLDGEWISKWLEDPKAFRPSTKMPAIFHLSNTSGPEDRARNDAAIAGITAYLLKNSESLDLPEAPAAGDAANGETLVKTLGCLGCHTAVGVEAGHFAPELSGLGSKVSAEWLGAWLKNPKHLSANTRMPNLRLSDKETADITAYLLTLKNEKFERTVAPKADPKVVDAQILELMQSTMHRSEAEIALQKMSAEERLEFLGKKSIAHQGCFACHTISGFEDSKPIGAELSDEGRKDIHKFDFGFVEIPKTRHDWVIQKLKEPRIFDHGKIKGYYEKLRMPQFSLSNEELEALTTFVLSLSEEQIPLAARKRLDLNELEIEKGRLLVSKLNCQGCHTLDGKNGTLRELTEDPGAAPPILDGEGAKVQEPWLHEFLKSPSTIRPWLTYHMPTFDLSDEELNTLVLYFHHLAKQQITFDPHTVPMTDEETLKSGKLLFDSFQCAKCHEITAEASAMGSSFLAPDLTLTKQRLKPEWVKQWLNDPQKLQEGTMMPTFFADGQSPMADVLGGDAEKQITAIRDYLYRHGSTNSPRSGEDDPKKAVTK